MSNTTRAHLVSGGCQPGAPAGHVMDYARYRLLELLQGEPAATAFQPLANECVLDVIGKGPRHVGEQKPATGQPPFDVLEVMLTPENAVRLWQLYE